METTYDFTVAIIKSEPKDDYPKYPVADPLCTLPERMVSNLLKVKKNIIQDFEFLHFMRK